MSQAKVDKYKEEKKNRAKTMKRNKLKKVIAVLIGALGLGAIIGIPLGKFIYTKQQEIEAKKRTIATADFDRWFEEQWAGKYAEMFGSNDIDDMLASITDASESDASDTDGSEIELDGDDIELDEGDLEMGDDEGEVIEVDDLDDLDLSDLEEE